MLNEKLMNNNNSEEIRAEYDFSSGERGKHVQEMRQGYRVTIHHDDGSVTVKEYEPDGNLVALDPDVRPYFPDSESVNRALRGLIELIPDRSP